MRPFGLFQFGTPTTGLGEKLGKPTARLNLAATQAGFFLRFRFGDRKEILRDRLEEFERPFSIDVISGHYILRDRWRNLRDRFGPSKYLKKTLHVTINYITGGMHNLFTIAGWIMFIFMNYGCQFKIFLFFALLLFCFHTYSWLSSPFYKYPYTVDKEIY